MATTIAEEVVYRGEGKRNLVVTNLEDRHVYRLLKLESIKPEGAIDENCSDEERSVQIHNYLENVVDYIKNVVAPIIGLEYVSTPKLVQIPKGYVEKIEYEIQHLRPEFRKTDPSTFQTVDPATCTALMLPDLCFVQHHTQGAHKDKFSSKYPTLSVEIKPKKGYLLSKDRYQESRKIKGEVCKFCLQKKFKSKLGRWESESKYCPLDLYSGDRLRMKHALMSLYETPQNNIRIFKDGLEVFHENCRGEVKEILNPFFGDKVNGLKNGMHKQQELHIFLDLVIDALLSTRNTSNLANVANHQSSYANNSKPTTCCSVHQPPASVHHMIERVLPQDNRKCKEIPPSVVNHCPVQLSTPICSRSTYPQLEVNNKESLPKGCVLDKVLSVQKLDELDIEEIHPLFVRLRNHLREHPEDSQKFGMFGPFTEEYWRKPSTNPVPDYIDEKSLEYAAIMVKKFLVSKTGQDCSIMVAMQRVAPDEEENEPRMHLIADCYGRKYRYTVKVIDLDPKPMNKISKYRKLEQDIISTYTANFSS